MLNTPKKISFSICTLVTRWDEYAQMKTSFEDSGFTDDCEYLVADNSKGNFVDAYEAIRNFLNDAVGKYVIVVHQDVRCVDSIKHLQNLLENLTTIDKNWAVCGNAGARGYHQEIMYINTTGRIELSENLPCRVNSLDENLLIIDADKRLTISADIGGFHFYGTDICNIADFLGYSAYVIPFMVKHLSSGNLKDMELYRQGFINKYAKKLEGRYIQTTCTKFYLSNSSFKNKFYNSGFIFFFIKAWQRFKYNRELALKGNLHKKIVQQEKS
ncbi:MAG: hypothetical protein ABIR78_11265 [Ferruginibacter sp.]